MGIMDKLISQAENLTKMSSETAEEMVFATDEEAAAEADVTFFMPLEEPVLSHVTCDVLNVRPTPSTKEERVGQLKRGAEIHVLAICDDWLKINFENAQRYVFGAYTDFESPEMTVHASSLNVRKAPGKDSDKIGSLADGTVVRVLGEKNGWAKILYENRIGYVSKEYLK